MGTYISPRADPRGASDCPGCCPGGHGYNVVILYKGMSAGGCDLLECGGRGCDFSMANVVHKDGVTNAQHQGNALQTVASLRGVFETLCQRPLQTELTM